MFRSAARSTLRHHLLSSPTLLPRASARTVATTAAKSKSTYKSTILRWGLAGAAIYYYNTSNVFADEPKFYNEPAVPVPPEHDERPPSLLPEKSHSAKRSAALKESHAEDDQLRTASEASTTTKGPSKEEGGRSESTIAIDDGVATGEEGGLGGLEEEAGQQGAFDPETGKINWDCPCLGGMAYGPCGSEFREAFSCFVYSTADPKGVDCIEKFKGMQTCFQQHPEIYGAEIDDDEEAAIDAKLDAMEAEKPQDAGESSIVSPGASTDARAETESAQPSTSANTETKPESSL